MKAYAGLLVALCYIACISAQCPKSYQDCVKNEMKSMAEEGGNNFKEEMNACFVEAGCKSPRESAGLLGRLVDRVGKSERANDIKACMTKDAEKGMDDFAKCVRNEGIDVIDKNVLKQKLEQKSGKAREMMKAMIKGGSKVCNAVEKCDNKQGLKDCMDKKIVGKCVDKALKFHSAIKSIQSTCGKKPAGCPDLDDVMKAMKKCKEDLKGDAPGNFEDKLKKCNVDLPPPLANKKTQIECAMKKLPDLMRGLKPKGEMKIADVMKMSNSEFKAKAEEKCESALPKLKAARDELRKCSDGNIKCPEAISF